jgi:hypothetical protein
VLALPLAIHLVRRLELSRTEFPALRWIAERARPRRRLRFERPWLLALRLALLALLALLLARPVLVEAPQAGGPWLFVVPGVDRAAARAAVPDLEAHARWLAPGFAPLDVPPAQPAPLASLLRELDATLPPDATPTVVVPAELAGLDGERPRLAHAVAWRVVPGRMPEAAPAPAEPVRIAVRYAPEAAASLAYLQAAVAAWNVREPGRYRLDAQPLGAPLPEDARWLAWLAPPASEAQAWIERGGTALAIHQAGTDGEPLWRDAAGRVLARTQPVGRGRVLALPGALAPADLPLLLDADFPERLLAAFAPAAPPTHAPAESMAPRQAERAAAPAPSAPASGRPLDGWLALLAALLFLAERILATRRPMEPAA